jgi:hypothetical protein
VLRLLEDPALIQAEIQRRLQSLRVEHPPATAARDWSATWCAPAAPLSV